MPELVNPTTGGRFTTGDRTAAYWLRNGWQLADATPPATAAVPSTDPAPTDPPDVTPTEPAPAPGEATTQEKD